MGGGRENAQRTCADTRKVWLEMDPLQAQQKSPDDEGEEAWMDLAKTLPSHEQGRYHPYRGQNIGADIEKAAVKPAKVIHHEDARKCALATSWPLWWAKSQRSHAAAMP